MAVQYIIGLAKQASSAAEVIGKLVVIVCGDEVICTRDFCQSSPQIWLEFQIYQKEDKEAAMLVKKQRTCAILDADDDGGGSHQISETKKVDSHKKHFRKKREHQEDEDEDVEVIAQGEKERRV